MRSALIGVAKSFSYSAKTTTKDWEISIRWGNQPCHRQSAL